MFTSGPESPNRLWSSPHILHHQSPTSLSLTVNDVFHLATVSDLRPVNTQQFVSDIDTALGAPGAGFARTLGFSSASASAERRPALNVEGASPEQLINLEIIRQLACRGQRVLACAPSNVAVDNLPAAP